MKFRPLLDLLPLALAFALLGCAATESYDAEHAPEYVVIREFSPFYQDGPMQSRGPDLSLRLNERVKLLKKDFTGFATVEISDGRRGFMGFEDLAPAPPRPPTVVATPSRSSSGRRSSLPEPNYFGPENNDVPLPDTGAPAPNLNIGPEEVPIPGPTMIDPEAKPDATPKFRY